MTKEYSLKRNKEKLLLQECVESGRSFVVDNTNPTREDREKFDNFDKEMRIYEESLDQYILPDMYIAVLMTQRRELFVDYEIPLGEDYREFVLRFLDED